MKYKVKTDCIKHWEMGQTLNENITRDQIRAYLTLGAIEEINQLKPKHAPGYYDPPAVLTNSDPAIEYYSFYDALDAASLSIPVRTNTNDKKKGKFLRRLGLCCETYKEGCLVIRKKEAYLKIIDELARLNNGWRPDWDDTEQHKWSLEFNHFNVQFSTALAVSFQACPDELLAKTEEIWKTVIEKFTPEVVRMAIWGHQISEDET